MNSPNNPILSKPSTTWVKEKHHSKWHYIVRESDGISFCNLNVSVKTAHDITKLPPKKEERCSACHAEAERLLKLWTAYKQRLRSNQVTSQPSALEVKRPASSKNTKPAYKHPEYTLETAMVIAAIKDLAKLGHQCNAVLEQKRLAKRKQVRGAITTASSTIQLWKRTCTNAFSQHPQSALFWLPILQEFSRPSEPCTYADLINHVNAVFESYAGYLAEASKEAQEPKVKSQSQKPAKIKNQHQNIGKFRAGSPTVCQPSEINDYWSNYERQGTRGSMLDPAKNSTSGVRGNPTPDRW